MGKPDPVIYKVALEMLQLPKEKVIAIGDSLQHDIQGRHVKTAAIILLVKCMVACHIYSAFMELNSCSYAACHDCMVLHHAKEPQCGGICCRCSQYRIQLTTIQYAF